ncbi:Rieske (2Fe-2S) protein [Streptomyces sp. HC44]|uniref:Cytochrome bc1 complex Rieske iron-sulfur subunit n=1 Tax=Streptomyces scabichelini TaxID=2711217 RepID=A0A6G4VEB2_9ACTN|nr:Rieske (2Fe-2S) protein [Streptomyces scabichelini]NGO12472.1 Rieske (2Fe-2S) protein [Streptomyces scabichelini]
MTIRSTRRTVLAAGAAGAAALVVGCSEYGNEGDGGAEEAPASEEPTSGEAPGGEELAKTSDIPVGGGKIFKDEKVVVTQPEQGDFKAFSAVCTHQRCIVANVSDGTINCTCHGSKFRVADASVADGPATKPLPEEKIAVTGNSIRLA